MQKDYLTLEDVAQVLGVTHKSARTYHQNAQRNRREGHPRQADMPAPDQVYGRVPAWKPGTIQAWLPLRGTY
jgi:prophage antirepressor-like protein